MEMGWWTWRSKTEVSECVGLSPTRTQPASLNVTLWLLSALEKTVSCDWRTIYLGEQAIYPWASLLISRTRRVGYTTQETDKCPKALAYIGRGGSRRSKVPQMDDLQGLGDTEDHTGKQPQTTSVYPW